MCKIGVNPRLFHDPNWNHTHQKTNMAVSDPSPRTPLEVTLKPVSSEADIPALADINGQALEGDPLKEWMKLFTERTERQTTIDAVKSAITDPEYSLIKAVIPDSSSPNGEKIVGFCHWFCGWIVLEKVDPFAKKPQVQKVTESAIDTRDVASNIAEDLAQTADKLDEKPKQTAEEVGKAARLRIGEARYIDTRNHYIGAIRGKKHMYIRRLMVLPEYQGRGIASKLLRVVTDEADKQKIVCWLFSRPAGEKLYTKVGFEIMGETEMDEKAYNFVCPSSKSMMRPPQPVAIS